MASNPAPTVLQISRYANRRFYDTTRSCNVGLSDLYQLILDGHDLRITDHSSGHDITNAILMQLILEREAEKLGVFPTPILHAVIRTQHQFLGAVVEQWFRQTIESQRAVQEQWSRFMRNTLGSAAPPNPLDWTRTFVQAFTGDPARNAPAPTAADAPGAAPPAAMSDAEPPAAPVAPEQAPAAPAQDEVGELRRQFSELAQRLDALSRKSSA